MLSKIQEDEQFYGHDSRICYLLTVNKLSFIFKIISFNFLSILGSRYTIYF